MSAFSITMLFLVVAVAAASPLDWVVVPSPNPGEYNVLTSVSAVSGNDIWAVGYQDSDEDGSYLQTNLAEHWNGVDWTVVPTPSPGLSGCIPYDQNYLYAVAAISTNDVWAVGLYCSLVEPGEENTGTLAMHWDGTQWTVIPTPDPGEYCVFTALAAIATNDVWAIGENYTTSGNFTLIEHWDGNSWNIVPSPNLGIGSYPYGATAISADDVWVVGYAVVNPPVTVPLTMHYDGNSWSIVSAPYAEGSDANELTSISGVASNDVWAVGYENTDGDGQTGGEGMMEHWDGSQWSLIDSPILTGPTYMYDVTAISNKNVWAVGSNSTADFSAVPLTEHWNGSTWTVVNSPNPGVTAQMYGVAKAGTQAWSVGAWGTETGSGVNDPATLVIKTQTAVSAPPLAR